MFRFSTFRFAALISAYHRDRTSLVGATARWTAARRNHRRGYAHANHRIYLEATQRGLCLPRGREEDGSVFARTRREKGIRPNHQLQDVRGDPHQRPPGGKQRQAFACALLSRAPSRPPNPAPASRPLRSARRTPRNELDESRLQQGRASARQYRLHRIPRIL